MKLVIGRYGVFRAPPPLTVAQAFNRDLRREMAPLLRAIVRTQDNGVEELWAGLFTHLDELSRDELEDLFSALANPKLERLLARPGFAKQVAHTLPLDDLRTSAAYGSFWDELMASPDARLNTWAREPDYPALLEQVFTTLLAHPHEPFATRLALFLGKVPYDARRFGARREDLRRLESIADRTLAPLLRDLLAREPEVDLKPVRDDLRKQLQETDVQLVRMQIQAAEALFRVRLSTLQSSGLPAEEMARAIQEASNEYRQQIAALTASLQKPA